MDDEELAALAADLESEQVERKESLANKSRVCQAVCAFANDLPNTGRPGYLLIGVTDDGNPTGNEITDAMLFELADLRSNGQLYPFPLLSVDNRSLAGNDIAVVTVHPSEFPPIRYDGRVWIRVGPSRRQATPEEERRLAEKRRAGDLPFDARPLPSATLDNLDLDIFRREYLPAAIAPDVLQANQRSVEEQLASLRFMSPEGIPTTAGVLVQGFEPTSLVPGAYVQFLRIEGTDLAGPIKDQKRLDGPLPQLLRSLDELMRLNVTTSLDLVSSDQEAVTPDYPLVALQQFVRNAVMHRRYEGTNAPVRMTWFSDRIELQSPGGPYGQVTIENFGRPGVTDYRNPTLAEAMRALGYVQRFGIGIQAATHQIFLLPGDLALARFEDELSTQWPGCLDGKERSFRVTTAFWRLLRSAADACGADVTLVDVGPNLGAINRAALVASDHVIPLAPDVFSFQGLRNLGPTLRDWRSQWNDRRERRPATLELDELPQGDMQPLGYVVLQHSVRLDRPVKAYDLWMRRIPDAFRSLVLDENLETSVPMVADDPWCIGTIKHYHSLIPMAQEARKPLFLLRSADGAIGAHQRSVQQAYDNFATLADGVTARLGITST